MVNSTNAILILLKAYFFESRTSERRQNAKQIRDGITTGGRRQAGDWQLHLVRIRRISKGPYGLLKVTRERAGDSDEDQLCYHTGNREEKQHNCHLVKNYSLYGSRSYFAILHQFLGVIMLMSRPLYQQIPVQTAQVVEKISASPTILEFFHDQGSFSY